MSDTTNCTSSVLAALLRLAPTRRQGLLLFASLLALNGPGPAAAEECPEAGPTDNVCINLKTTPECGEHCCTFDAKNMRTALVIGNNDYSGQLTKLCSAANDARTLALKLKSQDFNVCCLLNARQNHIDGAIASSERHLQALNSADPPLNPADTRFLMYFAGHGSHSKFKGDSGAPHKTVIYGAGHYGSQDDFKANVTPMQTIRDDWTNFKAVHPVIVLDACRTPVPWPLGEDAPPPRAAFSHAVASFDLFSSFARPGGYVVLFSTTVGSIASDRSSGTADDSIKLGRFMRFFSEEIEAWGRPLGQSFGVIDIGVRKAASLATPPDTQAPVKDENSPLYSFWSWRTASDTCGQVMNALGRIVNENAFGEPRCVDVPFATCVKTGEPSTNQCMRYKWQTGGIQNDEACRARIEEVFHPFFGKQGSRCATVAAEPVVSATNFDRQTTLAEARVHEILEPTSHTGTVPVVALDRGETALLPPDSVQVLDRVEIRSFPTAASATPTYAERGATFSVDCSGRGAQCSDNWIGVREDDGERLGYIRRSAVQPRSAAEGVVELVVDVASGLPPKPSLEILGKTAAQFVDKPGTTIRITTEVEHGRDAASLANADRRGSQLEYLLKSVGFEKHRFVREFIVLKEGLAASRTYVEFLPEQG